MIENEANYINTHCDVTAQVKLSNSKAGIYPDQVPSVCVVCGANVVLYQFDPVDVTLEIENVYPDETIRTTVETRIPIPPPPSESDYERQDWEDEYIMPETGTGRTEGDAAYFVTVTKSSRPDVLPVGTEFEYGT